MRIEGSEKVECAHISSPFSEFHGDVEKWQKAYFELLAWKNTWGFPYMMDICSYHDGEAYLTMVVKRDRADKVRDWLEDLGYGCIEVSDCIVEEFEAEYDESVDFRFEA